MVAQKRAIDWDELEKNGFKGFKVTRVPPPKANKKQKTNHASEDQSSEFPESELTVYPRRITPAVPWESMTKFGKFKVIDASFKVGTFAFVRMPADNESDPDAIPAWVAKIVECRASDPDHVYVLVQWMYRPEDLPDGRQPYHGDSELIASNHLDIIEGLSFEDDAQVIHWGEDPNRSTWPSADQLFWRQTLDITKPRISQLSSLRKHCIDDKPCNPDEPLIHCKSCGKWLHARCLEDSVIEDATNNPGQFGAEDEDEDEPEEEPEEDTIAVNKSKKSGKLKKPKKKKATLASALPKYRAKCTVDENDSGRVICTIQGLRTDQEWIVEAFNCLCCGAPILNSDEDEQGEDVEQSVEQNGEAVEDDDAADEEEDDVEEVDDGEGEDDGEGDSGDDEDDVDPAPQVTTPPVLSANGGSLFGRIGAVFSPQKKKTR